MTETVLQVLGADHYWDDRARVLKRLAKELVDRAQRQQLLMYAEADEAIAWALRDARKYQDRPDQRQATIITRSATG